MTTPSHGIPRRRFLRSAGAGAGLGAVLAGDVRARGSQASARVAAGHAKNVILLIADGMGLGTITLGDMYSRMTRSRRLHWMDLLNDPRVRTGLCDTQSADGLVSDSAATASAWSIGERVNNGAICFTPDGREPAPVMARAVARGMACGLVTTSSLTDATPACMYANAPKRNMGDEIGQQLRESGVSVMLGGGRSTLNPIFASTPDSGCVIVRTREELMAHAATDSQRLLGLFGSSYVPYVLDRRPETPSLMEMSRVAISRLAANEQGFMLQIEAGRVDHAAHANDAASLVHEMMEFDDVAGWVASWALDRGDTLVIITTDHANANPGLTLYGQTGDRAFERLRGVKRSFEWIFREFDRGKEAADDPAALMGSLVHEATGIELRPEDLRDYVDGALKHPFRTAGTRTGLLGALLANHFGVAFLSPNHTSDFVLVSALGPGSTLLPGFHHNTQLHDVIVSALGW